jgi:hypothetical protein
VKRGRDEKVIAFVNFRLDKTTMVDIG